jgi:serine/threonine protein kinase
MINKDICKIIDFGGIKLIGSKIYDKTCTLTSRSPEELLYEYSEVIISQPNLKKFFPNYGYKTDIWSLGIVLMELISGYNPLIKLYNKLKHTEKGNNQEEIEVNIENKICSVLNSKSHIQVNLDYLQKNNLQQMTEIKSKIERMLSIDPNIRYDNIDELYYDLFDEKLEILKKSEKTEPIYNINKDNLDIFNGFRKLNYNLVNEILFQTCDYNCLPLTISILDRYILKLLENSDENIINFLSESNKNLEIIDKIILFISASIISITLINRKTIIYEDILKTLNKFGLIDNKLMSSASINIKNLIMDITIVLDYNIIFDEYLFSDRTDPVNIKNIFVILYNKQY